MHTTAIRRQPTRLAEAWFQHAAGDTLDYRCYPDTDRFIDAFGPAQYRQALQLRAQLGVLAGTALGLHVRMPALSSRPADHLVRGDSRAGDYCQALETEVELQSSRLGARCSVTQLHLGGVPGWLDDAALERLLQRLHRHFEVIPQADRSLAAAPASLTPQRLAQLVGFGFTRIELDLHEAGTAIESVESGLQRRQPLEQAACAVRAARALGLASIGIELAPASQPPAAFAATLEQVLRLEPDRITLRTPRPSAQRTTPPQAAPHGGLHERATELLLARGYCHLGLGCYAIPGDPLAIAQRQGRLQRGPLGYAAQPGGGLIGLGVAAIGQIGAVYSQNAASFDAYCERLRNGQLPVARGLALGREDLLRRAVIFALLCQGRLEFEPLALAHMVDLRRHFAAELEWLQRHPGLVAIDAEGLEVTVFGCQRIAAIAGIFDTYRQADRQRALCSGRL